MRPRLGGRRGAWFAGATLLALAGIAAGCGRPLDESWLRVLRFEDPSTNGVISSVSSVVHKTTATSTELGTTDYVNAVFANQSAIVSGDKSVAGGVTVDQVRITYAIAGYAPPGATYAVTLYVPAGGTTDAKLKIALVSTALKSWLAATIHHSVITSGLEASARLVFHARTDDGGEVETEAGIGIIFVNETIP